MLIIILLYYAKVQIYPIGNCKCSYMKAKYIIFFKNSFQMVCDPNFRITSLCARWPGSTHDSRIWKTSSLSQKFENGM